MADRNWYGSPAAGLRAATLTTRRYRTIQIRADQHVLTAVRPLPPDLSDAPTHIR